MKAPKILTILAVPALLGLLAGCGGDETATTPGTAGTDDYAALDLNDPGGGLTETDEPVAFDDAVLKAMLLTEDGQEIDDPVADDPLVLRMQERLRERDRYRDDELPGITFARLTWGMLRDPGYTAPVAGPCDATDWTGTLRVDRGAVVVRRAIRFEFPADHVIVPRLDRRTVAFVSHTWCHLDGLVVQVVEPPLAAGEDPSAPNVLHIDTAAFQGEIPVAELAGMDRIVDVDDAGNRFHVVGFRAEDIEICPKGFLSGRYRAMNGDAPDTVRGGDGRMLGIRYGTFAGACYGIHGRIQGFMRGGFGVDAEGARVLVGKVIDRQGRFRGLIRGGWEPADGNGALARFRAQWAGRYGRREGVLGGEAHPVEGYPGGFFTGRWAEDCDAEATASVLR